MGADQSKKSDTVATSTDKYLPPKVGGRKKSALSSTADVSIGRGDNKCLPRSLVC